MIAYPAGNLVCRPQQEREIRAHQQPLHPLVHPLYQHIWVVADGDADEDFGLTRFGNDRLNRA